MATMRTMAASHFVQFDFLGYRKNSIRVANLTFMLTINITLDMLDKKSVTYIWAISY